MAITDFTVPNAMQPSGDGPFPIPFTRRQCYALQDAGLLTAPYELIDGIVYRKMPQKPPHAVSITLLFAWLARAFGLEFVRSQTPIILAPGVDEINEPEPDGIALRRPSATYVDEHPLPEDLLLLVEVSGSSLGFDLGRKAALYARAKVREYWVLDVDGRKLHVHREPADGQYQDVKVLSEHDTVTPLAKQDAVLQVAELLPQSPVKGTSE
jgi:Uma2 family endonuclease